MEDIDRDRVEELMLLMARGDGAAMFAFVDEFGGRLAGVVRRQLFEFGRRDVLRDPAQLDYLVQSAALAVFDRAGGWSPDGALPWTWAERAIRAEVVAYLGHPSVEYDPARHGEVDRSAGSGGTGAGRARRAGQPAGAGRVRSAADAGARSAGSAELGALARRLPSVALLVVAITEVASERDCEVHIQYRIQKRLGDPSPAHTVAAEFGLTPDHVRQIDHRVRGRLRALVDGDERFGALRDLHWFAA